MSAPFDARRVLVATDVSRSATAVAQYAALLARAVGATLHLVHYASPSVGATVEAGSLFPFFQSVPDSKATTSAQIALLAESVEQRGLQVHAAVIDAPRRYLIDQVDDDDILVLGTRPRGWLSMYLRPSFLSRCLSGMPGGLLIVPESAKAPGIDTVLWASGDEASFRPISSYAAFLSERLGAKLRVLAEFPSPLASAGAAYSGAESPMPAAISASTDEGRTLIVTRLLNADRFTRAERVAYEHLLRSSRNPVLLLDESMVRQRR
jgi:nucleotide-binding universal stress UspA family protein